MRNFEPEKMQHVHFSAIRAMMAEAGQMEKAGADIVHFDIGQPDFSTPKHILDAAKAAIDAGKVSSYTAVAGIPELRQACANKLNEEFGTGSYKMENIIVTCGGQEAIASAILGLLDSGDEILLPEPCYLAYPNMAYMVNAVPVMVPLVEEEDWDLDVKKMEAAITERTKILLLCSPNNPTGSVLSDACLKKIAEICIRKDLLVISDEAYERIVYDGKKATSIATLPGMKERTLVVRTFSKSDAMCGWRVGYVAAPDELVGVLFRAHNYAITHTSAVGQYAALCAITGTDEVRSAMVEEFARRRAFMTKRLEEMRIPFSRPGGAFYLFPNISSFSMSSKEFCTRLLHEAHVTAVPGDTFGKAGENHIRMSYATSMERCIEGMNRMEKFVKQLRGEA